MKFGQSFDVKIDLRLNRKSPGVFFMDGGDTFKINIYFSNFSVEDKDKKSISSGKKTFCAKCKCPKSFLLPTMIHEIQFAFWSIVFSCSF